MAEETKKNKCLFAVNHGNGKHFIKCFKILAVITQ